ncbi:hypothetical protein OAO18_04655 [Francisellaceae bacterium]|nr:hypothetical protein [Francisellaceae bacterium]
MKKYSSLLLILLTSILISACSSTSTKQDNQASYQEGVTEAQSNTVNGSDCQTDECKNSYTQGVQDEINAQSQAQK